MQTRPSTASTRRSTVEWLTPSEAPAALTEPSHRHGDCDILPTFIEGGQVALIRYDVALRAARRWVDRR